MERESSLLMKGTDRSRLRLARRGIKDGSSSPHIQDLRVTTTENGAKAEQAKPLAQTFQKRCPVFTTLVRTAPITLDGVAVAQ